MITRKSLFGDLRLQETLFVNRDTTRDVYKYHGVQIYHDVIVPSSIFKAQSQSAVVDLVMKEDSVSCDLQEHYCQEGYGYPVFHGNEICLTKAMKFIDRYLAQNN